MIQRVALLLVCGLFLTGCESLESLDPFKESPLRSKQETFEADRPDFGDEDLLRRAKPRRDQAIVDSSELKANGSLKQINLSGRQDHPVRNDFRDRFESAGTTSSQQASLVRRQEAEGGEGDETLRRVEIDFHQVDVRNIIEFMFQEYLKQPYVISENFPDTLANWRVSGRYYDGEIIEIFQTFLEIYGIQLGWRDGTYVLSSFVNATPGTGLIESTPGHSVQMWRLRHLSVAEAESLIQPVLSEAGAYYLFESRNVLLATDNEGRLARLTDFLARIDAAVLQDKTIMVYQPSHLEAEALASLLRNLPAKVGMAMERPSQAIDAEALEGNNRVVIVVDGPRMQQAVRQFLAQTDRPLANNAQVFHYPLRSGKATEIKTTLDALLEEIDPVMAEAIGIVVHEANNSLLINATPMQFHQIEKLINRLDDDVPSVMIDATLIEVELQDQLAYGVEWFLSGTAQGAAGDIGVDLTNAGTLVLDPLTGLSTSPGQIGVVSLTDNTFATLELLQRHTDLNILSRPRIMVENESVATIKSTDEIRVLKTELTSTAQQDGSNLPQSEFIAREFGVILQVTPTIYDDGSLSLQVEVEDSRRGPDENTASGTQPTFNSRNISTRLSVHDQQTIMIGGLIKETRSQEELKVPVLSDLPILGNAFSNRTDALQRTELVIFITPYVVDNPSAAHLVSEAFSGISLD